MDCNITNATNAAVLPGLPDKDGLIKLADIINGLPCEYKLIIYGQTMAYKSMAEIMQAQQQKEASALSE